MRAIFRSAGDQKEEKCHAHGDAVGDLFENARLRTVGDFRRDFAAAIHRPGMQDKRARFGTAETCSVELVAENVVFVRDGGFVHALGLHTKDENNVGVIESFFQFKDAADGDAGCGNFFEFARNPHRRSAEREAAAEFPEKMDIGAGDAAVLEVAENRDIQVFDFAQAIADSESVEKALRRVLVRAVAGVDDGNIEMASNEVGSAGGSVAHDEAIGLHGVKRLHSVEKRFAFFQAGGFCLEVHRVGAESGGGRAEADARASGIFEKGESDGFAAEGGKFFERMPLDFLKGPALVEKKSEFLRRERFKRQEIAVAISHTFTL